MTDIEARLAQNLIDEARRTAVDQQSGEAAFAFVGMGALGFVGAIFLAWILWYVFSSLGEYHENRRRWARSMQEAQADYAGALTVSDFEKAASYQALVEKRRVMEPVAPPWAFWHNRGAF